MTQRTPFSRRAFLGGLGATGVAAGAAAARYWLPGNTIPAAHAQEGGHGAQMPMTHNMVEGDVDSAANGFDPTTLRRCGTIGSSPAKK